jgi:hypothetical protein
MAKIEKKRGLVEALGYKRPVDIRAAWQDTLFAAGMRGACVAADLIAAKRDADRGGPVAFAVVVSRVHDGSIRVGWRWRGAEEVG